MCNIKLHWSDVQCPDDRVLLDFSVCYQEISGLMFYTCAVSAVSAFRHFSVDGQLLENYKKC